MASRHFLKLADFTKDELNTMLRRAAELKTLQKAGTPETPFKGKVLVMIFEKASTRTRVSFESGFYQLGGNVIHLSSQGSQLGRSESIEDTARVVSRMCDMVMIRTFGQSRLQAFADNSRVPVINLAIPEGYPLDLSLIPAGDDYYTLYRDPLEAARGADLVTTDVWTSMGFEAENEKRRKDFANYQVNAAVMAAANPGALFMHCLPAHRGEEVTAEVIDGPQSVVWDEAENRLHAQKGIMEFCMNASMKA